MPKNKFQEVIFTIIMVFVMVYAMICYNIVLNTGTMTNETFLLAFLFHQYNRIFDIHPNQSEQTKDGEEVERLA